ncbi:Endoribonuclease L-PSP/chorismate mutase-like protein [Phyllosticta citrichinensis]|uniref:Endoribonuclease L-PSP/chorismate mutase-like protein n=1 Tax=Phyllosticta citrichinensis TaxID=1130410 RepID=A0ABR1XQD5_9PEZI
MAHLKTYAYEGRGETSRVQYWYSQAVRVGDRIEIAGQGGWDPESGVFHADRDDQIDQAFANVELALKTAGGKGWSQVFRVNSYHVPMSDDTLEAMVRNFKKYMPNHQPIWTCIGVPKLADPDMKVEIEVVAHDEEAAKAAKAGTYME